MIYLQMCYLTTRAEKERDFMYTVVFYDGLFRCERSGIYLDDVLNYARLAKAMFCDDIHIYWNDVYELNVDKILKANK